MTIQHYQDRAMSTCMDTCMNPVYMLMNLGAEVGELQGQLSFTIIRIPPFPLLSICVLSS